MRRFLSFLKNPPRWFATISFILSLLLISESIACATMGKIPFSCQIFVYVLYGLSAIALGYAVYVLTKSINKIRNLLINQMKKHAFSNRILQQYGFRTIVFSSFSFLINVSYALFHGAIAIVNQSIWFGSLAAYYFLLTIMRGSILLFHRDAKKMSREKEEKRERRITQWCGIGLILLPLALSFAIAQMVTGENSFEHPGLMIYFSATYTFYKITMAIIHVLKARKTDNRSVRCIRSINLADAMVSILALQTAMMKEFQGDINEATMNIATGTGVCILTMMLGIILIVSSYKKRKPMMEENSNE